MGFDLWTLFQPVKFRESFSEEEQQNYDLLAQ